MSKLTAEQVECMMPAFLASLEKAKPAAIPLHKHGAFDELQANLSFLQLGADAMKGLGGIMQPSVIVEDFQLSQAHIADAAAVFRFFGEALRRPATDAYDAMEKLLRAAHGDIA